MSKIIMADCGSASNIFDANGLRLQEHFEKCRSLLGNFSSRTTSCAKNSQISQRGFTPLDSPTAKCHRVSTPKISRLWAS